MSSRYLHGAAHRKTGFFSHLRVVPCTYLDESIRCFTGVHPCRDNHVPGDCPAHLVNKDSDVPCLLLPRVRTLVSSCHAACRSLRLRDTPVLQTQLWLLGRG